ncbi:MAG TPA: porin [Gallionella sp.]|nr:porin [Gallionella sp.]
MQKKLIVVALAAAAFSTTALAETSNVSIYGTADLSYDIISTGASAAGAAGMSKNNVSSNVSKLGFKGSEGLSDGLTAVWQIEQQINMDNAGGASNSGTGNTLGSRNTFLGLKSDDMGTVLMGRHDTPYKLATRKLDIFGDSIADNRSIMGFKGAFDSRPTDVLAYISPDLNGFTGAIAYVNLAEGNTTAAQAKANALSAAGMFKTGPFYASLGYQEHNTNSLTGAKTSAWKLGASYDIDALTLAGVYEKTKDNLGTNDHNAYYLSANYKMDMNAIKFAYGKAGQLGVTANSGGNQISLGYDHGLSKRTKVYAIYSRISNQRAANYGFSQTTATSINGVGASPSVFSFGMKHSF